MLTGKISTQYFISIADVIKRIWSNLLYVMNKKVEVAVLVGVCFIQKNDRLIMQIY